MRLFDKFMLLVLVGITAFSGYTLGFLEGIEKQRQEIAVAERAL